jgi:hypothetical protein
MSKGSRKGLLLPRAKKNSDSGISAMFDFPRSALKDYPVTEMGRIRTPDNAKYLAIIMTMVPVT